ncbi:MAG: DNA primase [Parachlamydiaceae bacterium]|nr:DNA primase [Parachlamydiaceae bacterium]
MPVFSKDSLETLRRRIDLVDVLSGHIDLKRTGAAFKALCPFHDEKSPSFVVQKGDTHYHCFGCGAHGDAIQFLMMHLKMNFLDAVESLAQRFQVHLEHVEGEAKGPNKAVLKEALEQACRFFHFFLLHTAEGHEALNYLYQRGIDLEFIKHFQIGLAPATQGVLRRTLHAKHVVDDVMVDAGLLARLEDSGRLRDFFLDRITFPIRDPAGAVIGFSARKYKEETFGGKYVNTSETALFKKSRVLFGLNYCRRNIAKEQRAIIVEGQVDALRLIYSGFGITVAGQGTAFGESHAKELMTLGVKQVFLALDGDEAGHNAMAKIGNLFQKEGVEVRVVALPSGSDPDAFLRKYGPEQFTKLLETSEEYLSFLVKYHARHLSMESPAGKSQLIQIIATQIRSWSQPVMVHESLRKLAHLTHVPEETIGVGQEHITNIYIKKSSSAGMQSIDPDLIMESDFLRCLLLQGDGLAKRMEVAQVTVPVEALHVGVCQKIYQVIIDHFHQGLPNDLLSLSIAIDDVDAQVLISEILDKKVNKDKVQDHFEAAMQRILDRNWMEKREEVKRKIQSGQYSDDEVLELVKQFDALKRK